VICRPKERINSMAQIAPLAALELAALPKIRDGGILTNAYSPGGPRAVPLVGQDLVDTEDIEPHPYPAF
jgi:hypothetical protein